MGHVREAAVMWLETRVHRQIGRNVRRGSVMCRLLAGPGMWTVESFTGSVLLFAIPASWILQTAPTKRVSS